MKQKIIKSMPFADAKKIFLSAEPFFLVGHETILKATSFVSENNPLALTTLGTGFTNLTLALELYLKCLSSIERSKILKTHNLKILFDFISPVHRKILRQYHEESASSNQHFQKMKRMVGFNDKLDMESLLEEASESFIDFRYLFQNKTPNYRLDPSINAIRRLILEIHPEWPKLF
jgi:hypothetical protein